MPGTTLLEPADHLGSPQYPTPGRLSLSSAWRPYTGPGLPDLVGEGVVWNLVGPAKALEDCVVVIEAYVVIVEVSVA